MLPKDPEMLLSYINTKLRDLYPSLAALCGDMALPEEEIAASLEKLAQLPEEEYRSMCRAARRLWEDKFNAEKNYARFYEDLTRPLDGAGEENTR